MINKISKTDNIRQKLVNENKLFILNTPDDVKAKNEITTEMEKVRREYKVKERNSMVSAASVPLTA